jgi:hypothetical protein
MLADLKPGFFRFPGTKPTQKRINKSILIFSLPIDFIITISFLQVLCFGCVNLTSFACHAIQEMSFAKLL